MAQNDDTLVTLSGATFSLLVYENLRSPGDQMGFLLGDVQVFVSKKVTDTDQQVEHEKKHINIDGIIRCPKIAPFHYSDGRINAEEINLLLGDSAKRVVGWFKFRRSSRFSVTMREKIIHKELAGFFDFPEDLFLMCLVTKMENPQQLGLIHAIRHVFMRHMNSAMEALSSQILNLGTTSQLEGTDYKSSPKAAEGKTPEPDAFTKLLQTIPKSRQSAYDLTRQIHEKVNERLSQLIPQVCESEKEVHELETRLIEMKMRMRESRDDLESDDRPVRRSDSADLFSEEEIDRSNASIVNSQEERPVQKDEKNTAQHPRYSTILKKDALSRRS